MLYAEYQFIAYISNKKLSNEWCRSLVKGAVVDIRLRVNS